MTARSVGRCKVETASPTDGALGAVLAENDGGPLMRRGADKHRGDGFAIFAAIRRASLRKAGKGWTFIADSCEAIPRRRL